MTAKTNTNGPSDGKVRIIDPRGVQEQSLEHLDGEITIDLAGEEAPTIAADLESGRRPEVVVEGPGASTDGGTGGVLEALVDRSEGWTGPVSWLPVLPAVTFLVAVLGAVLVGPSIWSVEASPLGELAVRLGHVWLFGTSLAATLWMWNDGVARARRDADWQPDVTRYVLAGAGVLAVLGGGYFLAQGVPPREAAVAATGVFVAGLPASSIVAGPVYRYQRSRHAAPDVVGPGE